ncbi:MAG: UDP-N-acetylmuramoyl-tripeptide--D-alanyl-D-alanine ligase [Rickettsiales bacterium]|jgi:UDP-N-acetylmuramoyl-tripeptide--D-alanyl-D-alanine ligase|nr:UDP-N-acetylmuramoyl-tripeptide--D-alanyl-D-alanine ligase [Rickettsiales bacterium]
MTIVLILSFMIFAAARTIKACQFFQQEGYSPTDFVKFMFKKAQFVDKRLSLCIFFYVLASMASRNRLLDTIALSALFLIAAALHTNPFRHSRAKKKFKMTPRVWRIFILAMCIDLYVSAQIFMLLDRLPEYGLYHIGGWLILLVQSLPFFVLASDFILKPSEKLIKYRYYRQAYDKMTRLATTTIAITGSFGKTSTKNILHHILSTLSTSLKTPKSVNTLMGLVRVIREDLKPEHKYFVVEMGTSSPGKIARMSRLVRHKHAILTAVGDMHYEYFKDRDSVAAEKFAVFDSVKALGGFMIINSFQVAPAYSQKFVGGYKNALYVDEEVLSDIRQDSSGIHFRLGKLSVDAPVFGTYQAYDIALAITMAVKLGFDLERIVETLKTLPPTRHRQELLRHPLGFTLLDDAYNSNPDGFVSAMETARILADDKGGRAILCTPGMLELGAKHKEYHGKVAARAAELMDVVIAVVPDRIKDFTDEFARLKKPAQELVFAQSYRDADIWLAANARPSDVVLFENDLSDIYEEKIRI